MAPMRVVPAFQPSEDRHACLGPALEASPVDDFTLQCREETLGHRVIVSVAGRAHRWHDAGLAATLAERIAGVLATSIRMMDDRLRATLCKRNGPRELDSAVSEILHGFQAAKLRLA